MTDEAWFPAESVSLHFVMESDDHFTVDREQVEVGEGSPNGQFRNGSVKQWTIADGNLERTITEDEVKMVVPTVKQEFRDTDEVLDKPYLDDGSRMPTPKDTDSDE